MAGYYTFRKFAVEARGRKVTIVGKPGAWSWDGLKPGTAACTSASTPRPRRAAIAAAAIGYNSSASGPRL